MRLLHETITVLDPLCEVIAAWCFMLLPGSCMGGPGVHIGCLLSKEWVHAQGFDPASGEPKKPVEIESWPYHELLLKKARCCTEKLHCC